MLTAVRLVPIPFDVVQENWPKGSPATFDYRLGEMVLENTKALVLEFRNFISD
jgi:hypothetical protein